MSELIDLKEAAKFLKMHHNQLSRKAKDGEVKAYKPAGKWLFKYEDLEQYLEDNSNQPAGTK